MRQSRVFLFRSAPSFWYKKSLINVAISYALYPLSLFYLLVILLRRLCYRIGIFRTYVFPLPVIVVGNIVVGGTGKTPLVIWLARFLTAHGFKVGIVSRGYGRKTRGLITLDSTQTGLQGYKQIDSSSLKFTQDTPAVSQLNVNEHCEQRCNTADNQNAKSMTSGLVFADDVGDEAMLIHAQTNCPMVVGEDRVAAVAKLLECAPACNVIISDDGLQHYALGRDIEIALVDIQRKFGNGLLLPSGPLRERPTRLREVDFEIAYTTAMAFDQKNYKQKYKMRLIQVGFYRVCDLIDKKNAAAINSISINEAVEIWGKKKITIHVVAGIGNPERFFGELRNLGLQIKEHPFPDHYTYSFADFTFANDDNVPLIMTEKDAVKCSDFAMRYSKKNWWFLRVTVEMNHDFERDLLGQVGVSQARLA